MAKRHARKNVSRRALIRLDELRRMARVVRDEGVTFQGRVDPLGAFSFTLSPANVSTLPDDDDDLDRRIDEFGHS